MRITLLALAALLVGASPRGATAQSWLSAVPEGLEPGWRPPGYVPGRLLVKFKEGTQRGEIEDVVRAQGAALRGEPQGDGLATVQLAPGESVEGVLDRWSALRGVEYAAPDLYARAFFIPNDTTITTLDLAWDLRSMDMFSAWDVVSAGKPNVVLAIVDTGVAFEDHPIPDYELQYIKPGVTMYRRSPELPGPFRPGWDFVNDDAHPNDDHWHGTTCATIAAGLLNNVAGSAGVAPGVTILPVKVLDFRSDGEMSRIVRGIRFAADQGANIMNLSLGFAPISRLRAALIPENVIAHMFKPLRDAIFYAQQRGVIVVAATGNFGVDEISLPAGYPGVISVGASGEDGARATYSSYGENLDFVAPGGEFVDLNGDHVLDGIAGLGIKPYRSDFSLANPDSFNVFVHFGTSMAAPHVSGAVALLESMGMTDQGSIEQTLRASAIRPFGRPKGHDAEYGFGLIQLGEAVRHPVPAHGLNRAEHPGGRLEARLVSANPARGSAAISFRASRPGPVLARVYDARGALVRTVAAERLVIGEKTVRWDGKDERGGAAPSGIYFFRIETQDGVAVRKVAFLR
jgi:serine protease